jgi:hypothetical protein
MATKIMMVNGIPMQVPSEKPKDFVQLKFKLKDFQTKDNNKSKQSKDK